MTLDFVVISETTNNRGTTIIKPKFKVVQTKDLMIRGGDFYAVWLEDKHFWSTREQDCIDLIDRMLSEYYSEHKERIGPRAQIQWMWDAESGSIDRWHRYCQKQMRDTYHVLDETIMFLNSDVQKEDYASKTLNYPLSFGPTDAWDRLTSVLYSEEERRKIEWSIGAIVSGGSKTIQKFVVFYGSSGTGKSTILNIIQRLFDGYCSVFDAKSLGSSSNSFALEAFRNNPLVAIQHDGDLSKIEDNTKLNSLVSHEAMPVNVKHKSVYEDKFKTFLLMGTNKPVKITDGKSGILRRLIDISPTGNKVPQDEYDKLMKQIDFELGAIANKCQNVYLENPRYYDAYIPTTMFGATNDFYNFVFDNYHIFLKEDGTTLTAAWEMYKTYVQDANLSYSVNKRVFKEELKNYFWEYEDRYTTDDGTRVRSYYRKFRTDKFEPEKPSAKSKPKSNSDWLDMSVQLSQFDIVCQDCPAQLANASGTPSQAWDTVDTKLKDIDTSKLHWVQPKANHVVIDFDIPDEDGNKSFEKNFEAASKWPETYAEVSKSGKGIHLHYYYTGDVSKLSSVYDDHIEVKTWTGKSSLRRKLTRCNTLPIATLSSGLPTRRKVMVNWQTLKSEQELRAKIAKALRKEVHAATRPNVDFIAMLLEKAYEQGLCYDVSDMESDIYKFAACSTNQSDYCIKKVFEMRFKSDNVSPDKEFEYDDIVFFDCEVFPNLICVCWKVKGSGKPVIRMFNPTPSEIEELIRFKLIGFNNRSYDNHILYALLIGYDIPHVYELSKRLIKDKKGNSNDHRFSEAYKLSYTDIFDFASAGNKKSLKKLEIEMGIHHQELGFDWDQPVPEEMWSKVADYCENDVIATEEAFKYLNSDWVARQILADIAGGSVNDTTNQLSTKFIFEGNKNPQSQFNYRFMGDPNVKTHRSPVVGNTVYCNIGDEFTVFDEFDRPIFPGYTFDKFRKDKSIYRGDVAGEGGYVYAEPGCHMNVALLDVASMHPSSIIAENLFGDYYTKRFKDIRDCRVLIKHGKFEEAGKMFDGKLNNYLTDRESAKSLANALKTVINSVYGLTSASFENAFRDPRNEDNIVAKRGALFMVNLKHVVQSMGFTVAHIKTDSIKIPNATPELIQFVMDYGAMYGYTFEHEATYKKMCLVNDAVYIAQYEDAEVCETMYGYVPGDNAKEGGKWTATGTQFAVPYVFKTLFSGEPIEFKDMCETKSVTTAIYLDHDESLPDVSLYEELYRARALQRNGQKLTRKDEKLIEANIYISDEDLLALVKMGHDYKFIGKCGLFTPILPEHGGGRLVRIGIDAKTELPKYDSVAGAKDFRWLESEFVEQHNLFDAIDKRFYSELVDGAKEEINKYIPFDIFMADDSTDVPWYTDEDEKNFLKR